MTELQKLYELYEKIPATNCKPGCYECCRDIIQFTPTEEKNMGGYEHNGICSHLRDGKCGIYDKRPFVCRILGTSEILMCEDCTSQRVMPEEETMALVREYNKIGV